MAATITAGKLAERARFELAVPFRVRPLSRRVPSTTRPPLRILLKRRQSGDCARASGLSDCSRVVIAPSPSRYAARQAIFPASRASIPIFKEFQEGEWLREPGSTSLTPCVALATLRRAPGWPGMLIYSCGTTQLRKLSLPAVETRAASWRDLGMN